MTKEEYLDKLNALEKEMQCKKSQIGMEYALSNNPVKIGDLITDHMVTIKVEKIIPYMSYGSLPKCQYKGRRYTKKGVPAKSEEIETVYQSNLMYINGEKYSDM